MVPVLILLLTTSIQAVINQSEDSETQETQAQRREAPAESYGPPLPPEVPPPPPVHPEKEYGVPIVSVGPPRVNIELGPPVQQLPSPHPAPNFIPQRRPVPLPQRMNAIQRFLAGLRGGSNQGRVVNRIPGPGPQPHRPFIPQPQPQPQIHSIGGGNAGAHHSSSGSLKQFLSGNSHVSCEGWIPIAGPSISHGHGSEHRGHHESSGGILSTGGDIQVGVPQQNYGPPEVHEIGSGSLTTGGAEIHHPPPPPIHIPHNTYGVPESTGEGQSSSGSGFEGHSGSGFEGHSGSGFEGHSGSGFEGHSGSGFENHNHESNIIIGVPAASPAPIPHEEYGPPPTLPPSSIRHGAKSNNGGAYNVPVLITPEKNFGPPPLVSEVSHGHGQSHGHSHGGSLSGFRTGNQFGPPQIDIQPPLPEINQIQSSYGPPPSGSANLHVAESLDNSLQLPHVESAPAFSNVIGLAIGGDSHTTSEIVQSNTVHESHTQEVSFSNPLTFLI